MPEEGRVGGKHRVCTNGFLWDSGIPGGQGIVEEKSQNTMAGPPAGNARRGSSKQEAGSEAMLRQAR